MRKTSIYVTLLTIIFALGSALTTHAATITKTPVVWCPSNYTSCWPSAFAFGPSGNMYYVERYTGEIHMYSPSKHTDKIWGTVTPHNSDIGTAGEQGVLGLALHPDWPAKNYIYIYYTNASPLQNRVIRLQKTNGTVTRQQLITIPAGSNHNGGVIAFGPDKKLYVVDGETGNAALAQDLNSMAGKVLRLNQKGTIPSDNPFHNYIYSYGHRNSYGFAFDPFNPNVHTALWQTQNGPECNDELNIVQPGKNYGWGTNEHCPNTNNSGSNIVQPVYTWPQTIAITGAAFCNDCKLGKDVNKDLMIGDWNNANIYHVDINADRTKVDGVHEVYHNSSGILGLQAGTDHAIYFSDMMGIYRLGQE